MAYILKQTTIIYFINLNHFKIHIRVHVHVINL
jgi:hypothetical protein